MQLDSLITPSWCRWEVSRPDKHKFTIWLVLLYAFAGGFFSANLYYSHPILEVMAMDFRTTQSGVANIPTLAQAGDATGLLLILPLADFFPRRQFSLIMLTLTIVFWIPLCLTKSVALFQVFTYLSAITTGVIQIFLVLVSELSPTPQKRATNISIIAAGPTLGILLARILSGLVANFTSWRNIYWLSLSLQILMLALLWLFMPDYPATNPTTWSSLVKQYPRVLASIVALLGKYPSLVQACALSFLTFFAVSSYWTTLTFLLSAPPYNYSTFAIGLFGLIGAATMVLGPLYARYVIAPIGVPLISAAIGKATSLVGIVLGTALGARGFVAGPVIQALFLDAGLMILQISSRMTLHTDCGGEEEGKRHGNRINTAFVSMLYLGMLCGTKIGNVVYEECGGWAASGSVSCAVVAFGFVVILAKGPRESGWFGWTGGWGKRDPQSANGDGHVVDEEKAAGLSSKEDMSAKMETASATTEVDENRIIVQEQKRTGTVTNDPVKTEEKAAQLDV